jgi:hypothetical protein
MFWVGKGSILERYHRFQVRDGERPGVGKKLAGKGLLQTSFRAVLGCPSLLAESLLSGSKIAVDVVGLINRMVDVEILGV